MIWQRLGKELSYVILFFCMNDYAQISISASLVGLEDYAGPVSEISESRNAVW